MVLLDLITTPSWLPLAMVGVLLVVLGLLFWSMRHNLNRIDIKDEPSSPVSPSE